MGTRVLERGGPSLEPLRVETASVPSGSTHECDQTSGDWWESCALLGASERALRLRYRRLSTHALWGRGVLGVGRSEVWPLLGRCGRTRCVSGVCAVDSCSRGSGRPM